MQQLQLLLVAHDCSMQVINGSVPVAWIISFPRVTLALPTALYKPPATTSWCGHAILPSSEGQIPRLTARPYETCGKWCGYG